MIVFVGEIPGIIQLLENNQGELSWQKLQVFRNYGIEMIN